MEKLVYKSDMYEIPIPILKMHKQKELVFQKHKKLELILKETGKGQSELQILPFIMTNPMEKQQQ
jgi:hypothetical protein